MNGGDGGRHTIVCAKEVKLLFCGIGPVVLDVEEVVDTHLWHRLANYPRFHLKGRENSRCNANGDT